MRTVLLLVAAAALGGCIPETTDESGADAGLATTSDEVTLCTSSVIFSSVNQSFPGTTAFHGVTYVTGGSTDVEFTLPTCPWLNGVTVNGAALPTTGTIDNPDHYTVLSDAIVSGMRRVKLRLFLKNAQNGGRRDVQIWANNSWPSGARSLPLTWVGVAEIGRANKLSLSADELRTKFAASAYDDFGDDGWDRDDDTGALTGMHDFDYQALSVTIDDSIHFHASQKYRVYTTPFACDVTSTVDGRFRMSSADHALHVDWVTPLSVSLSSNGCDAGLSYVRDAISQFATRELEDSLERSIGEDIAGDVSCDLGVGPLPCADLIAGFEYAPGEVRTVLNLAAFGIVDLASITVKATYGASALGSTTGQLVFPSDTPVLITQEGLVNACATDTGNASTCNGTAPRKVGAAGYFNLSDKATWPVPDPYEYGTPPLPQREKALVAHASLVRAPSLLPAPSHYAGVLLGMRDLQRFDLGTPCILRQGAAGTPPVTVALGRNDRVNNGVAYGSGTALITARFLVSRPQTCEAIAGAVTPPNGN